MASLMPGLVVPLMAYRVERQQDKSYHVLMVCGLHLAVNRENHFIIIQTIITHTTIPILDSMTSVYLFTEMKMIKTILGEG
ncbi:hypothetical protein ASU87_07230 [Enterobacter roggenkampii]|nr:hypothetical protein ASU87_07230 [Enterobacter roggenkampii]